MRPSLSLFVFLTALVAVVAAAPVPNPGPNPAPAPAPHPESSKAKKLAEEKKEAAEKKAAAAKAAAKKKAAEKAAAAKAAAAKKASSGTTSTTKLTATTYSGQATFFYQEGQPGSCGTVHADSAVIVAMNVDQAGNNAHCGQYVHITNTANGKSITALVADECPGCGWGSLDLSTGAFTQLGSEDTGVLPITWYFT